MRNEEKITGGTFGISGIPRPTLLGVFDGRPSRVLLLHVRLAGRARVPAVVAAALAVGTRVRRAARQPDPRGEPGRQHHRVHAARVRDRRRVRRHRRRLLRVAGRVHRARSVPLLDVAHDAARGDRRRLGTVLRTGARHRHHHPAAGAPARQQHGSAEVHAEVVSRVLRRRRRRADGLAARAASCRSAIASGREAPNERTPLPRGQGHEEGVRRHQGGRRRQPFGRSRRDRRRDRSQRLGQDDAVQQHPRADQADRRQRRVLRRGHHRHVAAGVVAPRRGPDVPDAAGVRQALGARQPDRRGAGVQGLARRRA